MQDIHSRLIAVATDGIELAMFCISNLIWSVCKSAQSAKVELTAIELTLLEGDANDL